jgi:hypothetical protein
MRTWLALPVCGLLLLGVGCGDSSDGTSVPGVDAGTPKPDLPPPAPDLPEAPDLTPPGDDVAPAPDLAPPGDDLPSADAAACAPSHVPDGECGTCMQAACCDTLSACADDDNCWACQTTMPGPICHSSMETDMRVRAFWACQTESCGAQCLGTMPVPDGGMAMCQGIFAGACGTCLEMNCCTQVANCVGNTDCNDCISGTGGEAACHRSGVGHALAEMLFACNGEHCANDCR